MAKSANTIEEIMERYARCRSQGHVWEIIFRDWSKKKKVRNKFYVTEVLLQEGCQHCQAVRSRNYSVVGRRLTLSRRHTIVYPDGYTLKGGRLSRAEALYIAIQMDNPDVILVEENQ